MQRTGLIYIDPEEGTEIQIPGGLCFLVRKIDIYRPRRGDGNLIALCSVMSSKELIYIDPEEGTETGFIYCRDYPAKY